jgi:hypothetical protein
MNKVFAQGLVMVPKPPDLNEPCNHFFVYLDFFILFIAVFIIYFLISEPLLKRKVTVLKVVLLLIFFIIIATVIPTYSTFIQRMTGIGCI